MSRMSAALVMSTMAVSMLGGCASGACNNPYVLGWLDNADHNADLAYLGLVRDEISSQPGAKPDTRMCSVWQRVRNPNYAAGPGQPPRPGQPPVLLRSQRYTVTEMNQGWRVTPLP